MSVPPQAIVDEQAVSIRDMLDLEARVLACLEARTGFTVFTLNLDHLVKRRQSAWFRALYARATFVSADGWPVVYLARRDDPGMRRTTGADLVLPVCRLAARLDAPIYLFGTSKPILTRAAEVLHAKCAGPRIVGIEAPSGDFDPTGESGRAAALSIAASGARVCFVALGAPKQEMFADFAHALCPTVGFFCVGAALDYIAGAKRRAPLVVRKLDLEWAWRFAHEPYRLGPRYVRCAILFARLARRGRDKTQRCHTAA